MTQALNFYALDGKGGAISISEEQWLVSTELTWVHGDYTLMSSVLHKLDSLTALDCSILLANETRPRTMINDNTIISTLRTINFDKDDLEYDMVSIRLAIMAKRIITVQKQSIKVVADIQKNLSEDKGPKTSAEFLSFMLYKMSESLSEHVTSLDEQLDKMEDSLQEKLSDQSRIELNTLRRQIIVMRRYLGPQEDALEKMTKKQVAWINDHTQDQINELINSTKRIVENLDAQYARASILHEDMYVQSQALMNKKIYWLTIIACIFMPLSFITGLLGINVGGIPGNAYPHAFLIVCVMLSVICIAQTLYFRWKWKI